MAEEEVKKRKGGLGSDKGAARYERTSAEDRAKANSDGRFGYFDEVNKRYVPAFIDAMDGGGRDNRGDTFQGGPLSEILNSIGIKPYGSQRERMFVSPNTSPIMQAVAGGGANMDNSIRPKTRPMQAMPDELTVEPFNNPPPPMQFGDQPAGALPSMSFGQQPVGSMPAPPPNPFTGPTYDMPMPRPAEPSMNNVTRPSQFQNVFSLLDFAKSDAARQAVSSFYRYANAAGIPKTDENFARYQIEMY